MAEKHPDCALFFACVLTLPLVIHASFLFFRMKIKKFREKLTLDSNSTFWTVLKFIFVGAPSTILFYIIVFFPVAMLFVFVSMLLEYMDQRPRDEPFLVFVIYNIKKAMGKFLGDDFKEYLEDDNVALT